MSRFPVNKSSSARSFRKRSSKTHRANMISRGGFRL